MITGISDKKVVYDIPATRENIDKILAMQSKDIPARTRFVIIDGAQTWGGFTRDEFLNRHFDDLVFKSVQGYYPRELKQPAFPPIPTTTTTTAAEEAEQKPTTTQPQAQPQQQKGKVKEIKKGLIIEEEEEETKGVEKGEQG